MFIRHVTSARFDIISNRDDDMKTIKPNLRSEFTANQELASSASASSKMANIQATNSSFKFRLGAMSAMSPTNVKHWG